ncbi:tyrosine recombinase XerC [Enterobacter hormaechei]|nr:tyrosine recombinase XerC [Enterobacter hormaechei]
MMSLWDALRMNMMISYQELVRTFPDIPANQATHILRHTFASHFMVNGGNIISLQQILGNANIQQTMTYAHLSPEYLQNAVALNPLSGGISL